MQRSAVKPKAHIYIVPGATLLAAVLIWYTVNKLLRQELPTQAAFVFTALSSSSRLFCFSLWLAPIGCTAPALGATSLWPAGLPQAIKYMEMYENICKYMDPANLVAQKRKHVSWNLLPCPNISDLLEPTRFQQHRPQEPIWIPTVQDLNICDPTSWALSEAAKASLHCSKAWWIWSRGIYDDLCCSPEKWWQLVLLNYQLSIQTTWKPLSYPILLMSTSS